MLLVTSFTLLHSSRFEGPFEIVDTPLYERYGEAMLDGQVPYRDFGLEYPPAALPAFLLPALAPDGEYRAAFEVMVFLLELGSLALVVLTLTRLGAGPWRLLGAATVVGVAPLAIGTVSLTRFDPWPAFLTVAAVALAVHGRHRLGLATLGVAAVAKVYPAVLLPVLLVAVARERGLRETGRGLAAFAAAAGAWLLPFAILAPGELAGAFTHQAGRPLQVESLGAAVLFVAHQLGAYWPGVVSSSGSQNLFGALPDALATVSVVLQIVAVAGVWALATQARRRPDVLLAGSAAAVTAFVAFGKVGSPQFLLWLVPLVPLVGGRLGAAACGLLLLGLGFTNAYFPERYWDLLLLERAPAWYLLARDVALVALFAVLAAATARQRGTGTDIAMQRRWTERVAAKS